mmetsp:Transcript_617/g.2512  ORF Transcript_617/g.2512 Transcript_617/m.2512 type:complete len:352 (+) Transcript_617:467-1522(+)
MATAPRCIRGLGSWFLPTAWSTAPSMETSATGSGSTPSAPRSASTDAWSTSTSRCAMLCSRLRIALATSRRNSASGESSRGSTRPTGKPRMGPSVMSISSDAVPSRRGGGARVHAGALVRDTTPSRPTPSPASPSIPSRAGSPPLSAHSAAAWYPPLGWNRTETFVEPSSLGSTRSGRCAPWNMHTICVPGAGTNGRVSVAEGAALSSNDSEPASTPSEKPYGVFFTRTATVSPVSSSTSSRQISPLKLPKTPSGMRSSPSPDASRLVIRVFASPFALSAADSGSAFSRSAAAALRSRRPPPFSGLASARSIERELCREPRRVRAATGSSASSASSPAHPTSVTTPCECTP